MEPPFNPSASDADPGSCVPRPRVERAGAFPSKVRAFIGGRGGGAELRSFRFCQLDRGRRRA